MSLADFFDRIGNNFAENFDNAGAQGLASLGAAIASAPRRQWGAGLAQGLAQFKQLADQNKKKASLAEALKGATSGLSPQQQAFLNALEPEQQASILGSQLFKDQPGGPFPGQGFESAVANNIVRGERDPAFKETAEYKISKAEWLKQQLLPGPHGTQIFQRGFPFQNAPVQAPPTPQPPPTIPQPLSQPSGARPLPPIAVDPLAPEPRPANASLATLEPPPQNAAPKVTVLPGGSTITDTGLGTKPGEGEVRDIRDQLNTVLPAMTQSLNAYESALGDTTRLQRTLGPLGGGPMARLKTFHTDLLLQAKELYRLGVLNGPDYTLMLQMVDDPESVTATMRGREGLKSQIKAFREILDRSVKRYEARAGALGLRGVVGSESAPSTKPDPLGIR